MLSASVMLRTSASKMLICALYRIMKPISRVK